MDLWSYPWWILGLYSLTALFMLLFAIFLASYTVLRRGLPRDSEAILTSTSMESTPLGYTTLSRMGLHTPSRTAGLARSRLNIWVTRFIIAIVLHCAAIYLISAYPGMESPFWLGIILQVFIYGSAVVCYAAWGKEPYDE